MALIVQKYGGTSVGTVERIGQVADKIVAARAKGDEIVVVVSAMSGETDRLTAMAEAISGNPPAHDLDVLLSTGEQVTIALLSMALHERDCAARTYTGAQVPIRTDNAYGKARIREIGPEHMRADLDDGRVVVVAGFQGVDDEGRITTLGRGGSDTTAVALAAALKADECHIYTDVDGVYTTDPRIEPRAKRLEKITFEEMLEMASLGSKVLQIRAVEFAGKYNVPLRVLSTFEDGPGTLISYEDGDVEEAVISGIALNKDEAQITVAGIPDKPGVAYQVLGPIADANIEVDVIVQNVARDGSTDLTFTVHHRDYEQALELARKSGEELGAREASGNTDIVKISIVGVGMHSHAGVASRMFEALAREGINILMISTSEIKVSVVVHARYMELGVRALHEAFGLDKGPVSPDEPENW